MVSHYPLCRGAGNGFDLVSQANVFRESSLPGLDHLRPVENFLITDPAPAESGLRMPTVRDVLAVMGSIASQAAVGRNSRRTSAARGMGVKPSAGRSKDCAVFPSGWIRGSFMATSRGSQSHPASSTMTQAAIGVTDLLISRPQCLAHRVFPAVSPGSSARTARRCRPPG